MRCASLACPERALDPVGVCRSEFPVGMSAVEGGQREAGLLDRLRSRARSAATMAEF